MGFSGPRGGVLQGILGRRRGVNGAFCRGIPGGLGGVRVRRRDSAHGGQWRASLAKKFLKKGRKPKNWGARGAERWSKGTLYRMRGVIFESGG